MPFIIELPGPEGRTAVFGPYETREEAQAEADRFLLMVDVPVQSVSVGAMNHPDKLRTLLGGIAADHEEQEDGPWCDDCGDDATTTCPVCEVALCASCAGDDHDAGRQAGKG